MDGTYCCGGVINFMLSRGLIFIFEAVFVSEYPGNVKLKENKGK